MLFKLARKSLYHRKSSVLLTIVSITIGIMLLIAMNFINNQVKSSFSKTVSGIDLIVGSKTSDINLLLYSVFHMGSPANNIDWESYNFIKDNELVKSSIPISLGDSHRGFRVVGTNQQYHDHFKFGNNQNLEMSSGHWFSQPFEIVIGKDIADKLQYKLNDLITLSHGVSQSSFTNHDHFQFKISGIINKTGTPVDQTLFVSLSGLEAVHLNWPKDKTEQTQLIEYIMNNGLIPHSITAIYLTLENKSSTFVFQNMLNKNEDSSIKAILPGVALAKIWNMSKVFEQVLLLVGALVFLSTIVGLVNMLIASMQSRKKELALLRMIGASPFYCFLLIQAESLFILLISLLLALSQCWLLFYLFSDWLGKNYGFYIQINDYMSMDLFLMLAALVLVSVICICFPSAQFYKQSIIKSIN
ncbi:MAG: ABC transporter permease [Marinicellaceae bacterium]